MKMAATEFKAKCLALIDRVNRQGEPIVITKHGKVVARLVAARQDPAWRRLRERPGRWHGDPLAPVIDPDDVEAMAPPAGKTGRK
jgi:prevent-host-death family protein